MYDITNQMSICENITYAKCPRSPLPSIHSSSNLEVTIILIFFVVLPIYIFLNHRSLKVVLLLNFITVFCHLSINILLSSYSYLQFIFLMYRIPMCDDFTIYISCQLLDPVLICVLLYHASDAYMRDFSGYGLRSGIAG